MFLRELCLDNPKVRVGPEPGNKFHNTILYGRKSVPQTVHHGVTFKTV